MTCTYKHKIEFNQQFTPYLIFPFFFFFYFIEVSDTYRSFNRDKDLYSQEAQWGQTLFKSKVNIYAPFQSWCKPCYLTRERRISQRGRKRGKNHRKKKVMNFRLLPLVRLPPQARDWKQPHNPIVLPECQWSSLDAGACKSKVVLEYATQCKIIAHIVIYAYLKS